MTDEPNSRAATSERPAQSRIGFTQHSKVAQVICFFGVIQVFASVIGGAMAMGDNFPVGIVILAVGFPGAFVTIGFSYVVEYAARELTRMDRE